MNSAIVTSVLLTLISESYCHFNLNNVIRKGDLDHVKDLTAKDLDHVKDVAVKGFDDVKDAAAEGLGDAKDVVTKGLKLVQDVSLKKSGCECVYDKYDCGCCADIKIKEVHLDDTACVNVTYLPDQYGVSLTLSWDDKVIINSTVSARNPPPLCVGVPYVKVLDLCVALYDLDVNNKTFHGCAKIEFHVAHLEIEDVDLGCFQIPFSKKKMLSQITGDELLKQKAAMKAINMMGDLKRVKLTKI